MNTCSQRNVFRKVCAQRGTLEERKGCQKKYESVWGNSAECQKKAKMYKDMKATLRRGNSALAQRHLKSQVCHVQVVRRGMEGDRGWLPVCGPRLQQLPVNHRRRGPLTHVSNREYLEG